MTTIGKLFAGAAMAAASLTSVGASAGVITVDNPSFETLPAAGLPFGCVGSACAYSVDAIPGWTNSGDSGQFQPDVAGNGGFYINSVPDGITVGYSNGPTISQTVSPLSQAGVTYTLTVAEGFRKDLPDPGAVELVVNGVPTLATGSGVQNSGDWFDYTASYTALTSGGAIEVVLNPNGIQGDWDNVRLTDSVGAVPEPAAWALMLVGFGVLGSVMRRRTRAAVVA